MTDVVHVVGARPNFMKLAPIFHELRERLPSLRQTIVHTGQHYDREMSGIFVEELELPAPDHTLGVGPGTHGAQTGRALERIEAVLLDDRPRLVVVVGDVNSTLAGALAAAKLGIPVAHVEAGLRTFDRSMPEEINRVLVDQISEWCLIHSREAEEHLLREGVAAERIHFVGNTMIDTLVRLKHRIGESSILGRHELKEGTYALVTLHRPAIVDGPLLDQALAALAALSAELPVVFPVHPRTRKRIVDPPRAAGLTLIEPVGYVDFLALQAGAAAVITDSGGVQEETTFLGVPCFTLRDRTERPVTVTQGTNHVLGLDVARLAEVPGLLAATPRPSAPPEGWDGRAAARIAALLIPALQRDDEARPCAASAAP